jgi:NosR/NirI family nitrous oxide reductase transcriptional regulator
MFRMIVLLSLVPTPAFAQERLDLDRAALTAVAPEADTFSEWEGEPAVIRAFRTATDGGERTLVAYVFLTSDWTPEQRGYNGHVEALVGMDLTGTLTGIKVMRYRESLRASRGDFLNVPGFQEQYAGKHVSEPFQNGRDLDGITRATTTVSALSRGVRNSARKVAQAYLR